MYRHPMIFYLVIIGLLSSVPSVHSKYDATDVKTKNMQIKNRNKFNSNNRNAHKIKKMKIRKLTDTVDNVFKPEGPKPDHPPHDHDPEHEKKHLSLKCRVKDEDAVDSYDSSTSPNPEEAGMVDTMISGTEITIVETKSSVELKENDTGIIFKYEYVMETDVKLPREIEEDFKEHMFTYVGDCMCTNKRRLSMVSSHKTKSHYLRPASDEAYDRELEVVHLMSKDHDHSSGSCTPEKDANNTCLIYKTDMHMAINDKGDENTNIDETKRNLESCLKNYVSDEDYKAASDKIKRMELLSFEGEEGEYTDDYSEEAAPSAAITAEEVPSSSSGMIAGIIGGIAVLAALLLGVFLVRKTKMRNESR